MPYIKQAAREAAHHDTTGEGLALTAGALAYRITRSVMDYLPGGPLCFRNHAEVLGVIEAAKLEYYRRIVAPYEDGKCAENGDVYEKPPAT